MEGSYQTSVLLVQLENLFLRSVISALRLGESLTIKEVAAETASFQVLQFEMSRAWTSDDRNVEILKKSADFLSSGSLSPVCMLSSKVGHRVTFVAGLAPVEFCLLLGHQQG